MSYFWYEKLSFPLISHLPNSKLYYHHQHGASYWLNILSRSLTNCVSTEKCMLIKEYFLSNHIYFKILLTSHSAHTLHTPLCTLTDPQVIFKVQYFISGLIFLWKLFLPINILVKFLLTILHPLLAHSSHTFAINIHLCPKFKFLESSWHQQLDNCNLYHHH